MAHTLAGRASSGQPTTPLHKPALVAYSDSDSESLSSDTTGRVVDSEDEVGRLVAAEQLMALSTKIDTPSVMGGTKNSNPLVGRQEQLWGTTITMKERIAKVSHGHDQAKNQDMNMVDYDEAIPDTNNEAHDIEFEAAFAGTEEQAKGSSNKPRCWGDIKYPRIGTCDHEFKIANTGERYRKVVSDFFGRNKKATSSIPPECYPTICRTCYQRLAYRLGSMNKDDPEKDAAAVAKLRCDAIIAALEKMKEKTFVDHYGYEWPWWCGLELQLTNDGQALLKDPEELQAEIDKKNEEVAAQKAEKAKSPKDKSFKRLHKRVKPEYLPDWLQKLCQGNTVDDVTADAATSTIGDRTGVRYSFDELILIIKAIKTFCHESKCAFPTIEAIPVPIGSLDEQILKEKRKLRAAANNMKTKTKKDATKADNKVREQPSSTLRKTRATSARKVANDALSAADAAEQAVDNAQEDASLSAYTIPGKRRKSDATRVKPGKRKLTLKPGKKQNIGKAVDDDDDEAMEEPKSNADEETSSEGLSETEAADDPNDGDFEEGARTIKRRPAKRAQPAATLKLTSTSIYGPSKGSYRDWVRKKFGDNPPPPAETAAEARRRLAAARLDGYAVLMKPAQPRVYSDESGGDDNDDDDDDDE